MEKDLFGQETPIKLTIKDRFIVPPFSVLDGNSGDWKNRLKKWNTLGIKSEIGRNNNMLFNKGLEKHMPNYNNTSIFDAVLCELMYRWFCDEGGEILDPFAGGSVRGIVANKMGFKYTGIDIRQEQIDSNREQAISILEVDNQPNWYVGDSNSVLDGFTKEFDFVFSCPPYADLEVYSDLEGDISNMDYKDFLSAYESIIEKSCKLLKKGSLACFVVGEVRDKNGFYIGFVPDTIRAFEKCGMKFYNEFIFKERGLFSAAFRVNNNFKTKKNVKIHQNVLVFKKP